MLAYLALQPRAATAAYIAYQRSSNSTEEAESLVFARTYAPHAMASGARCTARFARDARGR